VFFQTNEWSLLDLVGINLLAQNIDNTELQHNVNQDFFPGVAVKLIVLNRTILSPIILVELNHLSFSVIAFQGFVSLIDFSLVVE
jgi:hypothetical protein